MISTNLSVVGIVGAEHLFHSPRLLEELCHGALVLCDVIARLLLLVK